MRYMYLFLMLLIACGNSNEKKSKKDRPILNTVPETYQWNREISDLNKKRIDLYGFIWMDTILPVIKQGNYMVYEKPNCYKCREVKIEMLQDLVLIDLIDTNHVPDSIHGQWRLIKVTGIVNNDHINPEKIERSVYSYPDYENSGYERITNEFIDGRPGDMKYVYLDGVIMPAGISFMDGYAIFSISGTALKKPVSIYIKKGLKHNQAEEVDGPNHPIVVDILDQNGESVAKKKVRLYGVWKNFINPEETKAAGMIFVESIKIME